MTEGRIDDTAIAAYERQIQTLQERITVLEAERRTVLTISQQYDSRLAGQSMVIQSRDHTIDTLLAEISALRQPCTHAPTWGVADCAWCQVRARLHADLCGWVSTGHAAAALSTFDAAVQAVREGQS